MKKNLSNWLHNLPIHKRWWVKLRGKWEVHTDPAKTPGDISAVVTVIKYKGVTYIQEVENVHRD